MAQKRTVSGIVTDSKNEPLIGVNVTIKNASTTGTITDIDGKYSLEIPSGNSVLVFSYIGYSTQEVKVSNRSVVDIVLKELNSTCKCNRILINNLF
ncbi:carboxypeptidase-like regulatory domain-containing protein, partial [Phocaeicola coprocola]